MQKDYLISILLDSCSLTGDNNIVNTAMRDKVHLYTKHLWEVKTRLTFNQRVFDNILFDYVSLSGEDLDGGILNSYVLEADEALVLSAVDHFDDDSVKSECALQTSYL